MIGLRDIKASQHGREIGECIYCGARDGPLSTEHAIPFGLNGPWTLRKASCEECAQITHRFERDVMRSLWPEIRNVLAMQSRSKAGRSHSLPLVLMREGAREEVQIPRTEYPTYLATPLFPPPACRWSAKPVKGVFGNLGMVHVCGPTFQEAITKYPGADFVGVRANFSAECFARMIAKIAFCAAISALGIGALSHTPIKKVILGIDPHIGYWVGGWWEESVNNTGGGLHEIRLVCTQPGSHIHAFVRLFAQFGAPEYHVWFGPADPQFVASSAWPAEWKVRSTGAR